MLLRLPYTAALLIVTTLAASWYAMMIVHEFGHVLAAWLTGGQVARVVLHPLAFSRTDLSTNSNPIAVVWGGPLVGTLLPLILWLVARTMRLRLAFLIRFFAGFCLIANGAYLAAAILEPVGDTGDMLRYRVPLWLMVAAGALALIAGFATWHRLGPHFGLTNQPIDRAAVIASSVALCILVAAMLAWSWLT